MLTTSFQWMKPALLCSFPEATTLCLADINGWLKKKNATGDIQQRISLV